ncbi:site-specific DNA-methyltransferase [Segatella copri]|uniref:DNA (Cytosine-5-)-methyltransferase n=1 Tax=Segatella copri DSM 18205 TaxID=537011 RepID=D1PB14_9BACT|nr:site-specific DNA-methyltransferase [Segatella copri]EFB35971.1 DNA (cytosine-5-)-methyltransferase [Segatella copri DSM 18205]MCW4096405.1 site-specific DNA-methyltransferase [Segatella copri]MQP19441.1 site-specific DNA-methyltransferase [Segatella copri DSM 18205]UEA44076.1 site-specific DNA-methyltransferase [Segatella copri DSM 18205]UWP51308.1 site-specific DNA-methyltransferase [Segatella copri DSM 18205]
MKPNIKFIYEANSSMGTSDSKNILIKGNNKDILPELVGEFGGKVKCVYIDPPYNNGDSYHYYNDNISETSWLKDISYVLMYLKMLLTKDGSIWISIDDSEMAYLKVAADKVLGRENFAGTIVWQQRKTRENRAVFSCNHEYILVYAKDIKKFKKSRNLLPVGEDFINSKYKNPDNDPRGPWQSISASVQAGHAVPSQFYTIVSPAGIEFNPPKGRCWAYNEERMKKEIANGNIWFGLEGLNAPRIKKFLSTAKIGLTPQTLWAGDDFGTTDSAKKHLLSLFPHQEKVFDTPKPEELIRQILEIATNEGDLVLDSYLGSGTTLAVAHKLKRNYIGIEIGEQMTELVVNRLKSVIMGEKGGISDISNWQGGGDFAYFIFDKTQEKKLTQVPVRLKKKVEYHQLDFFSLFEKYGDEPITDNSMVHDDINWEKYGGKPQQAAMVDETKNVLISLVKKDNEKMFLDGSATIYYTGKKFPTSVALNKLFYFMPYIKGKGVRDLFLIRIARLGYRKEGTPEEDKNDLRLVFEVQFVNQLFDDYKPVELKIWRTFTDTTIGKLIKQAYA